MSAENEKDIYVLARIKRWLVQLHEKGEESIELSAVMIKIIDIESEYDTGEEDVIE